MTKKEQLKEISRILSLKGKKRWRAVADFTLATNKSIKKQHDKHIKDIEDIRAAQDNDNGASPQNHNFRFGVSIPEGIWNAIVGFDMKIDGTCVLTSPKKDHEDPTGTNDIVKDLARTFPEYKVYKNIIPTEAGYAAKDN